MSPLEVAKQQQQITEKYRERDLSVLLTMVMMVVKHSVAVP